MDFNKVIFTLFLIFGAMVVHENVKMVSAQKFCPQFCYGERAYMTCPYTGDQHLSPPCNCCMASTGCVIYKADGTPICTAT
ncbi:hypothetical protein QN277_001721 [Acacia crassicarpa]|uniref:Uncharacterized protein n=1 Tax=Acacia crassicarpa TaxID=499986 RepID=A0AAE1THC3_9FABA|nr:hypothetical protein QN277_001721 [Acacia crassicarpa]